MALTPGRGANGKWVKTLEGAERDREAVRLRARGWTLRAISTELGYGAHQAVHRAIKNVLTDISHEGRDEAIALELDRLDMMYRAVIDVLETKHYTVSDGRIVYMGDKDDPNRTELLDDGPILNAVDRLLKITDRRIKVLGLEAPKRVEVADADSDLDAAYRELLAASAADVEVPPE